MVNDKEDADVQDNGLGQSVDGVTAAGENGDDVIETNIRETDIVFDCPHCGHNLAIDYRGAGLQINCIECGEPVLVPIPAGMKVDDLDLSSGDILKQLFQTRRMFQKSEQRVAELEDAMASLATRRTELERARMTTLHRCTEITTMLQSAVRLQAELATLITRVAAVVAEEQQR